MDINYISLGVTNLGKQTFKNPINVNDLKFS